MDQSNSSVGQNQKSLIKKEWTPQQNQALVKIVEDYGKKNWRAISKVFNQQFSLVRSAKQCREHYHNYLLQSVNNSPMTEEERKEVFEAFLEIGNKWRAVSQRLKNRTVNQVKNCFYSTIRKSLRRILKSLGRKKVSKKIKLLKPTVLSKIYSILENEFQNPNLIIQLLFHASLENSYSIKELVRNNTEDLKKVILILEKANKNKKLQEKLQQKDSQESDEDINDLEMEKIEKPKSKLKNTFQTQKKNKYADSLRSIKTENELGQAINNEIFSKIQSNLNFDQFAATQTLKNQNQDALFQQNDSKLNFYQQNQQELRNKNGEQLYIIQNIGQEESQNQIPINIYQSYQMMMNQQLQMQLSNPLVYQQMLLAQYLQFIQGQNQNQNVQMSPPTLFFQR